MHYLDDPSRLVSPPNTSWWLKVQRRSCEVHSWKREHLPLNLKQVFIQRCAAGTNNSSRMVDSSQTLMRAWEQTRILSVSNHYSRAARVTLFLVARQMNPKSTSHPLLSRISPWRTRSWGKKFSVQSYLSSRSKTLTKLLRSSMQGADSPFLVQSGI